jgi:hypothetical protein
MEGWIKLHRQLLESDVWTCEPFSRGQAWVDLLLLANHKNSFFYKRGNKIDVKRGQLARSVVELSDRWKWSRSKVNKFLKDLEKEQQIIQQKTNVTQLVTLINYDEFQEKEQQIIQQKSSRSAAEVQQKDTYKNVKNDNNEKNDNNILKKKEILKKFDETSFTRTEETLKTNKSEIRKKLVEFLEVESLVPTFKNKQTGEILKHFRNWLNYNKPLEVVKKDNSLPTWVQYAKDHE